MSLNTTQDKRRNNRRNGKDISKEVEAADKFVSLCEKKSHIAALAYYSSLTPEQKDYVQYSPKSQGPYERSIEELEGVLK